MWNRHFRLVIPEPPEGRSGLATIEAKSAQWWIITMMLAPIMMLPLVLCLPLLVTLVSAWNKPQHSYGWRCAVFLTVGGILFALTETMVQEEQTMTGWLLASYVLSLFITLPLAAASTWETWRRKRKA